MTKLESCLCTLKEDPDQYFQNLNTKKREHVDWKKRNVKSEKNEENKSSNEEEEEDHGATAASTGAADNFGFFQTMVGFSATSVPMWGGSRSSSSSYGYYSSYSHTSGSVCPFLYWVAYFPACPIIHLTSLCLCLFLFMKLMSMIVLLVIHAGIPAILTHLAHLILLVVPLVPLLHIHPGITLDIVVQIVSKNMLINTLVPLFPIHILTFNFNA